MACETRTVYPSKRNKGLSSTFQPPEEGWSVQWLKRCDKHGDKDEDNSPKNVNNVHNNSSQKYREILIAFLVWFGWLVWFLWHINLCRLFNAKSIFM